ncbi:LysM peptidoglycan-binding domain-containing protein [Brevibacillus daliensis]|uniref:LysM peptidoglycan-binding domain-containing protein n=1 Tax=Brevibacillus daliensis TaxID=2892995 RepID=UPI001E2DA53F|nr:LysM peptidoglycan-binding domain-containing protein [Brevibacillus daliensis]
MNYVVQPGDTLFSISQRFGVPLSELQRINRIFDPSDVHVGQTLFIPVMPGRPPGRPQPESPEDVQLNRRITVLEREVTRLNERVRDLNRRVRLLERPRG